MSGVPCEIQFFDDGQELLDALEDPSSGRPQLILLDLNMPRVDGRTALARIKGEDSLRRIPVVVLTTSRSEDDIRNCYQLGANSFISKPARFEELLESMQTLMKYWSGVVRLPAA